jgi:putative DNA primase/helicase
MAPREALGQLARASRQGELFVSGRDGDGSVITVGELAAEFGLRAAGNEWRGNCPCCGYHCSFVLTKKNDRILGWCASCRDSAAISALLRDRFDAREWQGSSQFGRTLSAASKAARTRWARQLWDRGYPAIGTLADAYLTSRGLPGLAASAAIRFLPSCRYPDGTVWPAMLSAVTDVSGELVAVHRTFLDRDGLRKAPVTNAKLTLGPVAGCAIRLDAAASQLVVGEGVESSASAGRLLGLPSWAAISAGNLARHLLLPAEIRSVIIAADNDPRDALGRQPGQQAASRAARRLRREGRRVRIALPDVAGRDFADLLRGAAHA